MLVVSAQPVSSTTMGYKSTRRKAKRVLVISAVSSAELSKAQDNFKAIIECL